jgi:alpha-glucosidase
MADSAAWWREGVLFQIYPRSFADSNGDGIGDLRGVIAHLDYLQWLGIDGIWLNPITVSPDKDFGYDVADYCQVQPAFGDLGTVDELIAEASRRGIRVILDLVPNHTSDQHPWFLDSRRSRDARRRDWYVWAGPRPHGGLPNNWLSAFGGPAWSLDDKTGQYYLHQFLPEQPDLNWWNPDVRDAFDDILRFWFDRGVAGFRIDVANAIVKDRQLRDNPPVPVQGPPTTFNANQPEVHEVFQRWRRVANGYSPPRILIGETGVPQVADLARYYGADDQLHLAFNFAFSEAPFRANALRGVIEATEKALPTSAWPVYTASNHDMSRFPTRWGDGDEAKARCALLVLLTLRGTPFLYYGDEIGMRDTPIARADIKDWAGAGNGRSRDPERTPMPWTSGPGAGFTTATGRTWQPLGDVKSVNVADQRRDPGSVLSLVRDLIVFRRTSPDLRSGAYASLPAPSGVWAWHRGGSTTVALNLSDAEARVDGVDGVVRIATDRQRERETVRGTLTLRPWQGVVIA